MDAHARTRRYQELLSPVTLPNGFTLKNRIVMAPMTRCFADDALAPTRDMALYYRRRADAGLIVSEATIISPLAQGYPHTPGIYSARQVDGWRQVTDAVHERDGRIFCQLWHTGRLAHSHYTGQVPLAPDNVPMPGSVPRSAGLAYEVPRTLTEADIQQIVNEYAQAAHNAIDAGFDGVEIHAANGYLIDQFLRQQTNRRADRFGGTGENRARFALEVVAAVVSAIGSHCTALRLSPQAHVHVDYTLGDEDSYSFLLGRLTSRALAYIHIGAFDASLAYRYLGGTPVDYLRRHYAGPLVGCGGYSPDDAEQALSDWHIDLAAFGRAFIANPDLVQKLDRGVELTPYDESMLAGLV